MRRHRQCKVRLIVFCRHRKVRPMAARRRRAGQACRMVVLPCHRAHLIRAYHHRRSPCLARLTVARRRHRSHRCQAHLLVARRRSLICPARLMAAQCHPCSLLCQVSPMVARRRNLRCRASLMAARRLRTPCLMVLVPDCRTCPPHHRLTAKPSKCRAQRETCGHQQHLHLRSCSSTRRSQGFPCIKTARRGRRRRLLKFIANWGRRIGSSPTRGTDEKVPRPSEICYVQCWSTNSSGARLSNNEVPLCSPR
mmetsp:Transcript_11153/g.18674  ORF Transcript_11153/g.18674 Transcript_11153/m.18674 type:complete len:252 (+) Transcript_11153:242-997(+)